MKNLLLLFLAFPLLFTACKVDIYPSPALCVDINIDTLSPEIKAVQYFVCENISSDGKYLNDTLFPLPLDSLVEQMSPIGIIISPKPDSAVIMVDGNKFPGSVKNDFRVTHILPFGLNMKQVQGDVTCFYKVKRCNRPDTMVKKEAKLNFKLFSRDADTLLRDTVLWMYNNSNLKDSIQIDALKNRAASIYTLSTIVRIPELNRHFTIFIPCYFNAGFKYSGIDIQRPFTGVYLVLYKFRGKLHAQTFTLQNRNEVFFQEFKQYSSK